MNESLEADHGLITIDLERLYEGEISSDTVRGWMMLQVDQDHYQRVIDSTSEIKKEQSQQILDTILYRITLAWLSDHSHTPEQRKSTVELIRQKTKLPDLQAQLDGILNELLPNAPEPASPSVAEERQAV